MRSAHLGRGSLANLDPHNGLNLYVYCNNNPVNVVDPSGLEGERPQTYSPLFDPRNAIDQMPLIRCHFPIGKSSLTPKLMNLSSSL